MKRFDQNQIVDPGRREFLRRCAGVTSATVLPSILQLQLTGSASAITNLREPDEYKALVCIFKLGGNDSYNMVTPNARLSYERYATARGRAAIPQDQLHLIYRAAGDTTDIKYGLHPSLNNVARLYRERKVSVISGIGSLVQPIKDRDEFRGLSRDQRPSGLFSHNDGQEVWQTALGSNLRKEGWAGRLADLLNAQVNPDPVVGMNVNVGFSSVFQRGANTSPFQLSSSGGFRSNNAYDETVVYRRAVEAMLSADYESVFHKQFQQDRQRMLDEEARFREATRGIEVTTPFPRTNLGNQLKSIARMIKARGRFGLTRQTFFATQGGYDTHNNLLRDHASQLTEFDDAIAAFNNALENELGLPDNVITFTSSEFGRTLSQNGRGTDHAWAGNILVMGSPKSIRGGRVIGDYPEDLRFPRDSRGNRLDIGRGRLLPKISVDELYAELSLWFGLRNDNVLTDLLPNLRNFYSASSTRRPINFIR